MQHLSMMLCALSGSSVLTQPQRGHTQGVTPSCQLASPVLRDEGVISWPWGDIQIDQHSLRCRRHHFCRCQLDALSAVP